jgi:hypothetical protein
MPAVFENGDAQVGSMARPAHRCITRTFAAGYFCGIGDGINGGVLSAMGKEYDDTVYISGQVRHKLMKTVDSFPQKAHLLKHLHNRGRRADKHGRLWRVYEVNHSAACSSDLHYAQSLNR